MVILRHHNDLSACVRCTPLDEHPGPRNKAQSPKLCTSYQPVNVCTSSDAPPSISSYTLKKGLPSCGIRSLEHLQPRPLKRFYASDKKTFPAASLKGSFCPTRPDTVPGGPSPPPPHRGRSGHAGHNKKRVGLPPVGDYFHKSLVRAFFSSRFPSHASHTSAAAGFAGRFDG
jgi:hypothetical protein